MKPEQIAQYWDDYAAEYDQEPDHGLLDSDTRTAWKDLLRMWLPPHPSDIADLACGTGTLSALAAELGHRVRAFDLSGEMVSRAQAKTAHFGAAVEVRQADVSSPPLEPGSVDAVLARHILWTLPDPQAALAAWAAAVRPGAGWCSSRAGGARWETTASRTPTVCRGPAVCARPTCAPRSRASRVTCTWCS